MKNNVYIINGTTLENVRNGYELVVIQLMKKLFVEFPDVRKYLFALLDLPAPLMKYYNANVKYDDKWERLRVE